MTHIENVANEIINLFEKYGHYDNDGEPVSQASHMMQCARLAMDELDADLTIAAFLHDIGYLLEHEQNTQQRVFFGVANHEVVGASFLMSRGFSDRVCSIVSLHVAAKRYLVSINKAYALRLSAASLDVMITQGGPMSYDEVEEFASHPYFDDIIKVCLWDEKAKKFNTPTLPLSYFRRLLANYLAEANRSGSYGRSVQWA